MKNTNKLRFKAFRLYLFSFLFGFIIAFIFVFSLLWCINKFVNIDLYLQFIISTGISFLLSVINIVLLDLNIKRIFVSKFVFAIKKNYPKLILIYFILIFLFATITNKTIWKAKEISDVLSVEWTIFGFSLMIFLVWDVLFLKFLKNKQPVKLEKQDFIQEYDWVKEKFSYYTEVETEFLTVILLVINLLLLIFSSSSVYITHKPEGIITQNIVILTFYFSTNTILSLFLDIIKPLWEEKTRLKKENELTKEEFDSAQGNAIFQMVVNDVTERIDSTEGLSEEEKIKVKIKFLESLKETIEEEKWSQ